MRLLGISLSYFQVKEISKLRDYLDAIGVSSLPGSGMYKIHFNQTMTAAEFSKVDHASHEALWIELRNYIFQLKTKIPSINSMTEIEHLNAKNELDVISRATLGLQNQPNLSSTRNEVQYRQKLSCWYPNARKVKAFHNTDRISQALSENFVPQSVIKGNDTYDEFFTKALVICGFMHQIVYQISKTSDAGTLGGKYYRFDSSLLK
jgi:hypothetical protein